MAELIMLTAKNRLPAANGKYYKNRNYTNSNAVSNLIRYITRARENEDRRDDLLGYGALGVLDSMNPENIIIQMLYIQNLHRIEQRKGRRMYHEVFTLYDKEIKRDNWHLDISELIEIGYECSRCYFEKGHQVAFAVHWEPEKHCHYHFAINTINYISGLKWHTSKPEVEERNELFNRILRAHQLSTGGCISPIYMLDDDMPSFEDVY